MKVSHKKMQQGVLQGRCTAGALPVFSTPLAFVFFFLHFFLPFCFFPFSFFFLFPSICVSQPFFWAFYILYIFFLLFLFIISSFFLFFSIFFSPSLHPLCSPSIIFAYFRPPLSFPFSFFLLLFSSFPAVGGNGPALPPRGALTRAAHRDAAPCPRDLWIPRCLLTAVCVSCLSAPGVGRGRRPPGGFLTGNHHFFISCFNLSYLFWPRESVHQVVFFLCFLFFFLLF